jgi:hypothetical protein
VNGFAQYGCTGYPASGEEGISQEVAIAQAIAVAIIEFKYQVLPYCCQSLTSFKINKEILIQHGTIYQ